MSRTTPDDSRPLAKTGEKWGRSGASGADLVQIRVAPAPTLLVKEKDIEPILSMSPSKLKRHRAAGEFPGNQARQLGGTWYYAIEVLQAAIWEYWEATGGV